MSDITDFIQTQIIADANARVNTNAPDELQDAIDLIIESAKTHIQSLDIKDSWKLIFIQSIINKLNGSADSIANASKNGRQSSERFG